MTQPKKILICDDEEGVRESIKVIVGDRYPMMVVDSGEGALHALANNKDIGMMFLDIKMPKVSGLDILVQIKKDYPHMKVIMITGYRSSEIAAEATHLGACGYLPKPFKTEELLETVEKHMG